MGADEYMPTPTEVWVDDDWQIGEEPYAEDEDDDLYFATIQKAINVVPPGTTVNVAAGNYVEDLNITKSLTLQGAGAEETFLTGGLLTIVNINLYGETVVFDGFTVSEEDYLIALSIDKGSSLTISNNILRDADGAAIYSPMDTVANGSSLIIENNEIYDNDDDGIYIGEVDDTSTVVITGSTIRSGYYPGLQLWS